MYRAELCKCVGRDNQEFPDTNGDTAGDWQRLQAKNIYTIRQMDIETCNLRIKLIKITILKLK